MARAFGAQLGPRWTIGEAVASPTARCMETAQGIVRGALDGLRPAPEVRPLPVLHFDQKLTGIPGLAGVFLDDPGFTALASKPDLAEYALLRETLLAELPFPSIPGVLNIGSTHDVLITFLQASLLGVPQASPADFPGFLEGVCLVKENGRVRLFNQLRAFLIYGAYPLGKGGTPIAWSDEKSHDTTARGTLHINGSAPGHREPAAGLSQP